LVWILWKDKKVRVNTISQSPTATKAGQAVKGFIAFADKMAPLGTSALDCANYTVAMFSDLTKWLRFKIFT
jgi:enoyl-[acyl-carrier protein] reductase I